MFIVYDFAQGLQVKIPLLQITEVLENQKKKTSKGRYKETTMKTLLKLIWIALAIIGGLAFIWLVILKILSRLISRFGVSVPCPASVSWIVDNPIRRRYMCPVLDRLGLIAGEHVLELGPGPGIFTVEATRRLGPQGRLIVVDIQPEMIAKVEKRIQQAGLSNVETHVANAYELPLPEKSIDRAFLVTVLMEIPEPGRALVELHRVLKPGGVLSITEEFLDPDYPFISETIQQVEAAGFKLKEKFGNWWLYTVNFVRV